MKKILFIITDLRGGGAERVLLDTVKKLSQDYEVSVLSIFNEGIYSNSISQISKYRYLYNLPKNKFLSKLKVFLVLRYLKYRNLKNVGNKIIDEDFDIEIAFLEGIPTKIVVDRGKNTVKIGWVHIDPIALPYSTKYFKNESTEKDYYTALDRVVCVSNDVKKSFVKKFSIEKNVNFIENVYDFDSILSKSLETPEVFFEKSFFNIICVGKLMKQKAYDRLIFAFHTLNLSGSRFKVHILGEGSERENLEKMILKYNLSDNIYLHGYQSNPYSIMQQADLFVSSSFTEGYSTVVVEAIVLGLPILVTDCSGMRDILGDSEYGMIVENSENGVILGLSEILEDIDIVSNLRNMSQKRKDFYLSDIGLSKLKKLIESF